MIFPQNDHMCATMYSSCIMGIWPHVFEEHPTFRKLYHTYHNIIMSYYLAFLSTYYIKLAIILADPDSNQRELFVNLSVTFIASAGVIRQFVLNTKGMKGYFQNIFATEKRIRASGDKEIIGIYDRCARTTNLYGTWYVLEVVSACFSFVVYPILAEPEAVVVRNETLYVKPLPLSSWFPWDEQSNYWVCYTFHIIGTFMGAFLMAPTDTCIYSLMTFTTGQIKILAHLLRNADVYVDKVKVQLNVESQEEAEFVTFRELILMHKEIIRLTDIFNDYMKFPMVFDFLQSSLQLACLIIQIVGSNGSWASVVYGIMYIISMCHRAFLIYYSANDIIIYSKDLGSAMWESDWHKRSREVKYMANMLILKTNQELSLKIGPFTVMSLATFLSVVKATYSYIMLMYSLK